jgi:subtilisin family serine protease
VQVTQAGSEQVTLARLAHADGVQEAALHFRARGLQHRPNDKDYSLQWNFEAIDMPRAWEINPGARSDVIVAIVDSGLNTQTGTNTYRSAYGTFSLRFSAVPDLVSDGRIVQPYDFVYRHPVPLDLAGHGTHVAGTIAQETNNSIGLAGIADGARLMPLKALSDNGWDDVLLPANRGGSDAVLAEAIRYAADNGAQVINLSLGSTGPLSLTRDAIQYAVGRGTFVAIAAGNELEDGNPKEYPAAYAETIDGAMAVGAVNRRLEHASYSEVQSYVEICAPGGEGAYDTDESITQVGYYPGASYSYLTSLERVSASADDGVHVWVFGSEAQPAHTRRPMPSTANRPRRSLPGRERVMVRRLRLVRNGNCQDVVVAEFRQITFTLEPAWSRRFVAP